MYKPNQQVGRVSSSFMPSWANEGRNIPSAGLSYYQLFPQSIEAALREADVVEKATKKRIETVKEIYSKMRKGNRRFKGGSTRDDDSTGTPTFDFDSDDDILGEDFDAAVQATIAQEQKQETPPPQGRVAFKGKRPIPPPQKRLREFDEVSKDALHEQNETFLEGQKAQRELNRLKRLRENPERGGKQPHDRIINVAEQKLEDLADEYDEKMHKDLLKFYRMYPNYRTADEVEQIVNGDISSDLNKAKFIWMHWFYQKESREKNDRSLQDQLGEPLEGAEGDRPSNILKKYKLNIINPKKNDFVRAIEGIRSGARKRRNLFEMKFWNEKK